MKKILIPLIALVGWLAVPHAQASWMYMPLELRLAGAKFVVVGKIDRIVDGIERHERTYDVGAIKVSKVLKGPKTLKEVKLMWPGPAPFALSTDIKYRKGQEGIWILYPDKEEKNVYWASYPTDFQQLKELPQVETKMKGLEIIAWSKPVGGLQLGAIVEQSNLRGQKVAVKGRPVQALANATAYVLVRNSGKAATHVVNFPPDQAFTYRFIGPDGKQRPITLGRAGAGKLAQYHYLPVAVGELKAIGYGVRLPMIVQPGRYTLELGYTNKRNGGKLIKGAVWTGELKGKVVFNVK
ncbi:MAG: hypothetical protein H8E27_06860 [Verrucomicrobia subdivision 3 bacterium]|nr:hypothetical protein [Limisphaerales bacterium]